MAGLAEEWGAYGARTYQRYALYWPADADLSDCAGAVLLHGGGWKGGNLREHTGLAGPGTSPTEPHALAQHLAGLGYAAMSAGYTIDPPVNGERSGWPIHPLPMLDTEAAWDWLAPRTMGRPSLVGNSAGALNALMCRRPANKRVAISAPVGDLPWDSPIDEAVSALFGAPDRSLWRDPTLYRDVDLLIHGTKDATVPLRSLDTLRGDGVDVRVLDGAGHQPHTDERYRAEVWRLIVQHLEAW